MDSLTALKLKNCNCCRLVLTITVLTSNDFENDRICVHLKNIVVYEHTQDARVLLVYNPRRQPSQRNTPMPSWTQTAFAPIMIAAHLISKWKSMPQ
jgi:hypothetical protein